MLGKLATAALIGVNTMAIAYTVNVDFSLTDNHPGGDVAAVYSGTAAAPDAGTVWNELKVVDNNNFAGPPGEFGFWDTTTSLAGLSNSLGSPTSIGVSAIANPGNTGAFGVLGGTTNIQCVATDAVDLMRDYLIGFNNPQQVVLSGFALGDKVDLYLYGAGDTSNRDTVFTVSDVNGLHSAETTGTISNDGGSPVPHSLTPGGDYVVLSGLIPNVNGEIAISYFHGAGSGEAPFNGLQAVVTSVPEPSAVALLGVIWGGLYAVGRAQRNG